MLNMKRHNSKGFTLVELLAVIAILGIIMIVAIPGVTMLINRSKSDSRDSMEKTLEMAARSYASGNSQALPKVVGESTLIKAKDLKKTNFLKEDLVDYDKNSCMDDSVVRIYKYANNGYTYTPYLYCEGDEVPDVIEPEKPVASIVYTDEQGNNIATASENVTIAMTDIDIKGNSAGNLALDGYSYAISACYKSAGTCESDDLFIEVYNSGSIDANDSKVVNIHKQLRDYVDITTVSTFKITVSAYNIAGGVFETSLNSFYLDETPPTCVHVENSEPADDYWNNQDRKRTITIKCSDGNGSGCVRDRYVKTFTTEMDKGVITIEDNAGNKTDCSVNVHLDWTAPTLTINAYKRNADGSKGSLEATIVANDAAPTQTLTKYASGHGADQWLNIDNFPNGIYYEMSVVDNVTRSSGRWSANQKGLRKDNITDFDYTNEVVDYSFDISNTVHNFYIDKTKEGWRKGNIVVTDLSGNKVRVNILAALDLEHPVCSNSGEDKNWRKEDLTLYGACTDNISGCVAETIQKTFTTDINTTTASPGTVEDKAGNKTNCASNQTVKIDKTAPANMAINMYKATSDSAPTSTSGLNSYSSGTWTNTNVYAVVSGATDGGSGLKGYYLTSTGVASHSEEQVTSKYYKTEGTTTSYWKVCDNVGNCYTAGAREIKIDKTAPVINSIVYQYRSSLFGNNDKCQMVPNGSCDFVDCKGYYSECDNEKNRRLVLRSNTSACVNYVRNHLDSGCSDSTVSWKYRKPVTNTHNEYNVDYIGDIFNVNGGHSQVWFDTSSFSATDATSQIKIKKIYAKYDYQTGFGEGDLVYNSQTSGNDGIYRTITSSNHGSTLKLYVEDYAGNYSTWLVYAQYTGNTLHTGGFWKYTPLEYNVLYHRRNDPEAQNGNYQWAYWVHGWAHRFYIRTFLSKEDVVPLTLWAYYSDKNYRIFSGEGNCGAEEGCQLHGWRWINGSLFFLNTNEYDINVTPNGGAVENDWVTACRDSNYYLIPPEGGCNDSGYMTKWCSRGGYCS